jgi:hypothetical protein
MDAKAPYTVMQRAMHIHPAAWTGRRGAFKLANSASRIGECLLVSDLGVTRVPVWDAERSPERR